MRSLSALVVAGAALLDSYASYPSGGRLGPGLVVAPGLPGNPYLQDDFDRAVPGEPV
jgi:hypothetical protein